MRKRLWAVKKLAVSPGDRSDGITLVEVIVSMALLGIVVVLISTMLMAGFTITYINQPKTSNIYKVGGRVTAGGASAGSSTVADGVIVSGDAGSVTVSIGGSSSNVPGTYQNGATVSGTSSQYAASAWAFNPNS